MLASVDRVVRLRLTDTLRLDRIGAVYVTARTVPPESRRHYATRDVPKLPWQEEIVNEFAASGVSS